MRNAVLFSLLISGATFAQTQLPAVDVPVPEAELNPGSPTRKDPSAVATTLDAAPAAQEAKDTAQLLTPAPGTVLQDAGGFGQRKSLSLRGASASGVIVLLDGIPLSSPGTSVDLSRLPPALFESLDVLRGTASSRYGPGALGGVLNLNTRRTGKELSMFADGTWGSFGLGQVSAGFTSAVPGGEGLVLVHGARSDGDFGYLSDPLPALDGNPLVYQRRLNNQASIGGGLLKHRAALTENLTLHTLLEGTYEARGLAGTGQNPTPQSSERSFRGTFGTHLDARFQSGGELTVQAFARLDDVVLDGTFFGSGPLHQREHAVGTEAIFTRLFAGRHGVTALATATAEWLVTDSQNPAQGRFGVMAGDDVQFFGGDLSLGASVRIDRSGAFTGISPKLSVLALLPHGLELRANAGQAFRPPGFLELYVLQGHLAPNPNLRPERGLSVDAAAKMSGAKGSLQLAGFAALYEDLITYEYYPPQLSRPYNFQAARAVGLEAEGAFTPTSWLAASASYTLLSTQNLKDDPRYFLKTIPYRPAHKLFARLAVGPGALRGHVEVLYQSSQFTNRTETLSLPERTFVNAGLSVLTWRRPDVRVSFEMKNLLDQQTSDLDGYPLPSRSAYLTLSLSFSKESPL